VCDGPFYKGKVAAIVGGGNSAVQEALYLSDICANVHLIHRRDSFRAEKSLVENAKNKDNIIIHTDSVISSFIGENQIKGLTILNKRTSEVTDITCDVLFEAIGRIPENNIFSDLIELDGDGYVIAKENCATSCPGIFVAGDCRQKNIRQLTTAVADGSTAALAAVDFLN
jgi:thioredoxin reductase (NADPH)